MRRRDAFAGSGVNDTCEHGVLRMPHDACEGAVAAADARGTSGTAMPLFNEDPLTGARALNSHPLHFYTFEGARDTVVLCLRRDAGTRTVVCLLSCRARAVLHFLSACRQKAGEWGSGCGRG